MREPEVRTIGDATYEIRPLNTSAMLRLMTRLARILGPSVGLLDNPAQLASMTNIGRVLAELAERLDDDDVLRVVHTLAESTTVVITSGEGDERKLPLRGVDKSGNATGQFELQFAGDPVSLFRWLGLALEVNFGPLAAWLAKASKTAPAAVALAQVPAA